MKLKSKTFLLFFIILIIKFFSSHVLCNDRAIVVSSPSGLNHNSSKVGKYTAIIIGIDKYMDDKIPDLKTPVRDAKAISQMLEQRYGFTDITMLLNEQASREKIDLKFRNKINSIKTNDNILIYYAGHGDIDRALGGGWWIPSDAKAGIPGSYIDNAVIQKYIKAMKAKHVLMISDSCYSGTLFGEARDVPKIITDDFYLTLYNEKSRWGMTSGNKTPVSDSGTDNHSIFAYQLLKAFNKNKKSYVTPRELYAQIGPIIRNNSEQMPICKPIKHTGDQGGEFVFLLASGTAIKERPEPQPVPRTGSIQIETEPSGAKIYLNNTYIGTSPFNKSGISDGKAYIRVKKQDYHTLTRTIDIKAGRTKYITIVLDRKIITGKLFVNAEPTDCRIKILNIKPVFYQGISLKPGSYNIEVSKTGYKTLNKWIVLDAGQSLDMDVSLKKIVVQGQRVNNDKPIKTEKMFTLFPVSKDSEYVIVAISEFFPPMVNTRSGQPKGFEIDLINEIAQELGKKKIQYIIGKGAIIPVSSKKADLGIGAVSITDKRKKYINFSNYYYKTFQNILVNKDSNIFSYSDLKNRICVVRDNSLAERIAEYNNFKVIKVNTKEQLFESILNKHADYTILDRIFLEEVVKRYNNFKIVDIRFKINPKNNDNYDYYGIVIHKDNLKLVEAVNDSLTKIKNDGRLEKIRLKWLNFIEMKSVIGSDINSLDISDIRKPIDNIYLAWENLDLKLYLEQWSSSAVQYLPNIKRYFKHKVCAKSISCKRREDFSKYKNVEVLDYQIYYVGKENNLYIFDTSYTMKFDLNSGRTFEENGIRERYKVTYVNADNRWKIIENIDYAK